MTDTYLRRQAPLARGLDRGSSVVIEDFEGSLEDLVALLSWIGPLWSASERDSPPNSAADSTAIPNSRAGKSGAAFVGTAIDGTAINGAGKGRGRTFYVTFAARAPAKICYRFFASENSKARCFLLK